MQIDSAILGTVNAGLGFGIFFMFFLVVLVAFTKRRKSNRVNSKNGRTVVMRKGSITKDVAILGILFFITAIVFGVTLTGYFVQATQDDHNFEQDLAREKLRQELKDTLLTIDLMSAQSEMNSYELQSLRYELEDAYNSLNTKKSNSRTRFVPIVPGPLY